MAVRKIKLNANAKRLYRDTAGRQSDKGTETAHGTRHVPATVQHSVSFKTKRGVVSFGVTKREPASWSTNGIRNHNTNMQTTRGAAVRPRKGAGFKQVLG